MVREATPPGVLYARYQKLAYKPKDKGDVICNIAGNPRGDKRSWIPFIYAITEDVLDKEGLHSLYYLKMTLEWPLSAKLADETADNSKPQSYETYQQKGYVGVVRGLKYCKTVVIFDPTYYIHTVYDMGIQTMMYYKSKPGDHHNKSPPPYQLPESPVDTFQHSINTLLLTNIGLANIDPRKDYFCVSEIARRKGISPQLVASRLSTILERISVNRSSGCWVSSNKKDYLSTFWLALGGLTFNDVFRFPHDLTDMYIEPPVIKNRFVLHHPICELTLKENHIHCCRPSHLRLGTSMENAYHIKIRQAIEQLFDFTPEQLKQYVHHVNGIACLIQHQISTTTPHEASKIEHSKRHKRVNCFTNLDGSKRTSISGKPHMGDSTEKDFLEDKKLDFPNKDVIYENFMQTLVDTFDT